MKLIASWSDQIAQIHSVLLIRRANLLVNSVLKINLETIIMPIFSSHFLRGCLSKNRPLNFAWKIILPETLASERLYRDYN